MPTIPIVEKRVTQSTIRPNELSATNSPRDFSESQISKFSGLAQSVLGAVSTFSNQAEERQIRNDRLVVRDMVNESQNSIRELNANLQGRTNKESLTLVQDAQTELSKISQRHSKELTPSQQELFKGVMFEQSSRFLDKISNLQIKRTRKFEDETLLTDTNNIIEDFLNEDRSSSEMEKLVMANIGSLNLDIKQKEAMAKGTLSDAYKQLIKNNILTDPQKANELLSEFGNKINASDRATLTNSVNKTLFSSRVQDGADRIILSNPESVREIIDQASKIENQELSKAIEKEAIFRFNREQQLIDDENSKVRADLEQIIYDKNQSPTAIKSAITQANVNGSITNAEANVYNNLINSRGIKENSLKVDSQLIDLELDLTLKNKTAKQVKKELLETKNLETIEDYKKLSVLLSKTERQIEKEETQAIRQSNTNKTLLEKQGLEIIENLRSVNAFGDRVIKKGQDITDKRLREESQKLLKSLKQEGDDAPGFFFGFGPDLTEEEAQRMNTLLLQERENQESERLRNYNTVYRNFQQWIRNNGDTASLADLELYLNNLTQDIRSKSVVTNYLK